MKKKIISTHSLILCLTALFSINLTACNTPQEEFNQKEFIEVGLSNNHDTVEIRNIWNEFYTGLKAKTKKNITQDIEVFYGNQLSKDFYGYNDNLIVDLNQKLEFRLTRYIYSSLYNELHNQVYKSTEILVRCNTLEYFFSDEFNLYKNSIIDTINVNDLTQDYEKYGTISYKFVISPLDNELIKLHCKTSENQDELIKIYPKDKIYSYYNCYLDYTIDENNQISIIEREEIKGNYNE